MFSARGLKKHYGREKVLDLKALEIPRGKVTVFLGHNGAGKTTLLRILGLLERPSAGMLSMDGLPVDMRRNALELRRRMTLAHQTPYLFKGSVFFQRRLRPSAGRDFGVGGGDPGGEGAGPFGS